jgi:hypothetical protein
MAILCIYLTNWEALAIEQCSTWFLSKHLSVFKKYYLLQFIEGHRWLFFVCLIMQPNKLRIFSAVAIIPITESRENKHLANNCIKEWNVFSALQGFWKLFAAYFVEFPIDSALVCKYLKTGYRVNACWRSFPMRIDAVSIINIPLFFLLWSYHLLQVNRHFFRRDNYLQLFM